MLSPAMHLGFKPILSALVHIYKNVHEYQIEDPLDLRGEFDGVIILELDCEQKFE
jgi:hypothetical protein